MKIILTVKHSGLQKITSDESLLKELLAMIRKISRANGIELEIVKKE